MATYKILYWQEVPSQVRAEDDQDEVNLQMPARFMEHFNRMAMKRGLQGSDRFPGAMALETPKLPDNSFRFRKSAIPKVKT